MRTDRFATNRNFAQFILAELFQRKNILNVRIHLNWTQIPTVLRREFATKIARRFRNNISRFYFPDARNGNFAVCVIYLHEDDCPHLHILVELPDNKTIEEVRRFVGDFVRKPRRDNMDRLVWDCVPAKKRDTLFYVEEAHDLIGSLIYNQRYGLETALLF